MIYGDDVSHVVTEEGIAYLYKTDSGEERRAAARRRRRCHARGLRADPSAARACARAVSSPIRKTWVFRRWQAQRSLLAARSIEDLVAWSDGLYKPPARFRNW